MSKAPLFSTYRQGENRVTSSILAVLERIDFGRVEELLAAASGESVLEMVRFVNQPRGLRSVPGTSTSVVRARHFSDRAWASAAGPGRPADADRSQGVGVGGSGFSIGRCRRAGRARGMAA